jgi:hypothetical protein
MPFQSEIDQSESSLAISLIPSQSHLTWHSGTKVAASALYSYALYIEIIFEEKKNTTDYTIGEISKEDYHFSIVNYFVMATQAFAFSFIIFFMIKVLD